MGKEAIYEEITLLIEDAIDTEVGEKREYKPQTELTLQLVDQKLKKVLGLPPDFYL